MNAQIAKSPNNSSFYDLLTQLQIQNKNLDQAAASVQKAIQLNPEDGEAVMLLAQIQVQRGQTANAIGAWEQWLKTHPSDANADAILGTLEESREDKGKAEAYYKASLQIQPQQPIAANNLAYLMLQNGGNVDVALTLACKPPAKACRTHPTPRTRWRGPTTTREPMRFARDLWRTRPRRIKNAIMQYHLGMVYSKLHDKNNAILHLERAVSLAPDSPTAKDAKAALQTVG